jgi:hypothetical protein
LQPRTAQTANELHPAQTFISSHPNIFLLCLSMLLLSLSPSPPKFLTCFSFEVRTALEAQKCWRASFLKVWILSEKVWYFQVLLIPMVAGQHPDLGHFLEKHSTFETRVNLSTQLFVQDKAEREGREKLNQILSFLVEVVVDRPVWWVIDSKPGLWYSFLDSVFSSHPGSNRRRPEKFQPFFFFFVSVPRESLIRIPELSAKSL